MNTRNSMNDLKSEWNRKANRMKRKIKAGQLLTLYTETHENKVLYCGRIEDKYLLYNNTLKCYKLVKQDWFSNHIKNIELCKYETTKYNTHKNKWEFHRKLAKAKKERYIREHGCNRN